MNNFNDLPIKAKLAKLRQEWKEAPTDLDRSIIERRAKLLKHALPNKELEEAKAIFNEKKI